MVKISKDSLVPVKSLSNKPRDVTSRKKGSALNKKRCFLVELFAKIGRFVVAKFYEIGRFFYNICVGRRVVISEEKNLLEGKVIEKISFNNPCKCMIFPYTEIFYSFTENPLSPDTEDFLILGNHFFQKYDKEKLKIIFLERERLYKDPPIKRKPFREIYNCEFSEEDLTENRSFETFNYLISKDLQVFSGEKNDQTEKIRNKISKSVKENYLIEKPPCYYCRIKPIKEKESGDRYYQMQHSDKRAVYIDDLILKYTSREQDGKTEIALNFSNIKEIIGIKIIGINMSENIMKEFTKRIEPKFLKEMKKGIKIKLGDGDIKIFKSLGLLEVLYTLDHSKRMITECVLRPSLWTHGIYYPIWYNICNKFIKFIHKRLTKDIKAFGTNKNFEESNNKKFMFKEYFFKGFSMALGIDKEELEKHFDKMEKGIKRIEKEGETKYVSTFTIEDTREFLEAIFSR